MKQLRLIFLAPMILFFAPAAQAGWSAAQRLTWTPGDSSHPSVAADSNGSIHAVWEDDTPGNNEIYYRRSTDGGSAWSAVLRLTWNSGESVLPAIAAGPGNAIHVVWMDSTPGTDEIYFRRSDDGGSTWSTVQRLTWNSGESMCPTIAVDSSAVIHIAWMDYAPANDEVYYMKSANGGASWSAPKRLTWTATSSFYPVIASYSNTHVHVVWYDDIAGNPDVYYKRSWDGGSTWGTTKRLTANSGWSCYPVAAADSTNGVHIAWHDDTSGNQEIYYDKSPDGGSTWGTVHRLTWTSGWSYYPVLAVDPNDHIHLVWYDDTPGNSEVYYRSSSNGGTTWSTSQRLTWMSGSSVFPALAIDSSDTRHLLWSDGTPGNYEIYYRKGN